MKSFILLTCFVLIGTIDFSVCIAQQPSKKQQEQFDSWDKNGNGKLELVELPVRIRERFTRFDRNKDGFISRAEHFRLSGGNRQAQRENDQAQAKELTREILSDISYVPNGHRRQKLDLYLPKTEEGEKVPLVIWIHGGAWRGGTKQGGPWVPLLKQNVAVASINYRLSQDAIFPAQIQDCKAAVRWLRKNADKYNIDPDRFGAWGASAGGHLVALLGTSGDVAELEMEDADTTVSSRVQVVCNWFGAINLLKMNEQSGSRGTLDHDAADSPESMLIGGPLQENPEIAKRISPTTYISEDDSIFLHVHGDSDRLISVQQSRDFHKALTNADLSSELIVAKKAGHGFTDPQYRDRSIEFLVKHLKK